jgi:DNA-binding transcriptional LysR family regulator
MARDTISDVLSFLEVAKQRSFTRAAEKLEVTPSALSHTVRALETRMGVRLLNRTTRSVAPTEAGQRLLDTLTPQFEEIEAEVAAVSELREKPAGTIRITALDFVADTLLWPRLAPLLLRYPDLRIEINTNYALADIAAERFDLGVRTGSDVAKDMVAARISPDYRRLIVGAPSYFKTHGIPQTPEDLAQHNCITMRLTTGGGLYAWHLVRDGAELQLRVSGQCVFNNSYQILGAALAGSGLAFTLEPLARAHVAAGQLQTVMDEWCPTMPGFHLYYPSRRQQSRALALVIEALRAPS